MIFRARAFFRSYLTPRHYNLPASIYNPLGEQKTRVVKGKNHLIDQNCTKKCLNDPDNHNAVVTQLEPDVLECDVKWTLGSITINKASGGDGIPTELL